VSRPGEEEHLRKVLIKLSESHDELANFMLQHGDSLYKEVFPKFSYCMTLLHTLRLWLYDAEEHNQLLKDKESAMRAVRLQ